MCLPNISPLAESVPHLLTAFSSELIETDSEAEVTEAEGIDHPENDLEKKEGSCGEDESSEDIQEIESGIQV